MARSYFGHGFMARFSAKIVLKLLPLDKKHGCFFHGKWYDPLWVCYFLQKKGRIPNKARISYGTDIILK